MKITKNLILIFTILFLGLSCRNEAEYEAGDNNTNRPNIIYILADDLGYGDLSCYGQEKFSTPNIDKLAAEGMKFTQHYAGSTVCAPSRSVLMSGLHTGHTPVRGNKNVKPLGNYPIPDSIYTIAELFKDAGYITGAFGKWGLGSPYNEGNPLIQGFAKFYGYYDQGNAHRYYPEFLWDNDQKVILYNNEGELNKYAADIIHKKALEFITENKDENFFLYLPYTIPHAELIVPEDSLLRKYRGKFRPEKQYNGNDYFSEDFRAAGYASQEESHAVFAAMINRLDLYVGDIIKILKEFGIEENTIVIFTSDNGPHLEGGADPEYFDSNGPLRGFKRDLYEGGIRVPFIVKWPAVVDKGSESDHISAFYDMLPTFADIIEPEKEIYSDGISILPALSDKRQKDHDYLYWEFHERGGKQAVRMGKWKAVRLDVKEYNNNPVELYNLEEDPGEENNIASEHPDVVKEINEIMKNAHTPSEEFHFINN